MVSDCIDWPGEAERSAHTQGVSDLELFDGVGHATDGTDRMQEGSRVMRRVVGGSGVGDRDFAGSWKMQHVELAGGEEIGRAHV